MKFKAKEISFEIEEKFNPNILIAGIVIVIVVSVLAFAKYFVT